MIARMRRVAGVLFLLMAACVVCGAAVPAADAAGGNDAQKRDYYSDRKLVTQDGREVRFYSDILKDRVVLINFFFTNCRTTSARQCKVISDLQRLLGSHLGKDVFLVSMTVDPVHDTPDRIKSYARVFAARKGWIFLTGKKENVDFVNMRLGSYTDDPNAHPAFIILANVKTGHWIKVDPDTGARELADRLLKLLTESRGGR